MNPKCQAENCERESVCYAVLQLRAHPNHPPTESAPLLYCCEEHSGITWNEAVTEKVWLNICQGLYDRGKQIPKRLFSNLKIVPLPRKQ